MKKRTIYNKTGELSDILNDAMQNLKRAIDVNTIVGTPIINETNAVVIPVSKVYVGIVSGGGEINNNCAKHISYEYPFAGGTGAGFTISPIGFLVVRDNEVTFVNTEVDKSSEKLIEMANKVLKIVLDKVNKES